MIIQNDFVVLCNIISNSIYAVLIKIFITITCFYSCHLLNSLLLNLSCFVRSLPWSHMLFVPTYISWIPT